MTPTKWTSRAVEGPHTSRKHMQPKKAFPLRSDFAFALKLHEPSPPKAREGHEFHSRRSGSDKKPPDHENMLPVRALAELLFEQNQIVAIVWAAFTHCQTQINLMKGCDCIPFPERLTCKFKVHFLVNSNRNFSVTELG